MASPPVFLQLVDGFFFANQIGDIGTQSNAVRHDAAAKGVSLAGVFSEPLAEGEFNGLVRRTRNKSTVLIGQVLRVLARILRSHPGERIRVCVDRLGGRTHYRDALMTAMPGCALKIVEESETRSAYALTGSARILEVEFATGGDRRRFPVALASVYSKYLRELYMRALNAYWSSRIPGLRPTAGYYVDARRWLGEVTASVGRLAFDRDLLVRAR